MHRSFLKNTNTAWPTDGSGATLEATYQGLEKNREILAVGVEIPISGKSTGAGTFALAAADYEVLMSKLFNRVRQSQNGNVTAVDVTPKYLRDVATHFTMKDPYQLRTRAGATIPGSGSAAGTLYPCILIPFYNKQRSTFPDRFVPSGHSLAAKAGKLQLVAAPNTLASLNAVVLANGTFNMTAVGTPRVFVVYGARRKRPWVSPTLLIKERGLVNNPDTEVGYYLPELEFETRDAATLDAASTGGFGLNIDGQQVQNLGTTFRDAVAGYSQATEQTDGGIGYDITQNTNVAGESGRTPFLYVPGGVSADEDQTPLVRSFKTLSFATQSAGTLVTVRWSSMFSPEVLDAWNEARVGTEAEGMALEKCAIKGGMSPAALLDFYPRYLAPPSAAA